MRNTMKNYAIVVIKKNYKNAGRQNIAEAVNYTNLLHIDLTLLS